MKVLNKIIIPVYKQEDLIEIVDYLIAYRRKLDITQQALSEKTGITQTRLSKYERKKQIPKVATLIDWAEGLGLIVKVALAEDDREDADK